MSNVKCKPTTTQVIGPILDGDEVIIGAVQGSGMSRTFNLLNVANDDDGQFTSFTLADASEVASTNNRTTREDVPKFRIWFLSEDASGGENPLVFFTFSDGNAVNKGEECNGGCIGVSPTSTLPFPGISATYYTPSDGSEATPSTRYLSPGAPSPLQLVAVDGERSWFPMTLPIVGSPKDRKYVLALSNVAYTINAFINGKKYENVAVPDGFIPKQSGNITVQSAELNSSDPQVYYIIPTKYFTSTAGSEKGLCSDCSPNTDGGLGAFCSVGCTVSTISATSDAGICCDESCLEEGSGALDCTKVCKYGFTQKDDCKDRCFYNYCTIKESSCGGDCKSACPPSGPFGLITNVCLLDQTTNSYMCTTATGATGTNEGITTTEIAIIALATALIFGLVIFAIYAYGTNYSKKSNS